jgi:hypothetical protein
MNSGIDALREKYCLAESPKDQSWGGGLVPFVCTEPKGHTSQKHIARHVQTDEVFAEWPRGVASTAKAAADYRMLSVKRSPYGDCLAIRNASRDEQEAWVLFSEEGEITDGVDHDTVSDWPDMIALSKSET